MTTAFPFDPSGTSTANRITNEQHVITSQNFRDYHYVIPKFGPFFEANTVIKMQYPNATVRILTYGVDYYFSNQFLDASRACSKPLFGSISFLDTDTAGILSISYNTVGGIWNISADEITRILAEELRNPRITTWEQIVDLPQRFPVVDHEWDLVDMVGASGLVASIDLVRDAIIAVNGGGLNAHINNYSNPHATTKAQVGLSNVENYAVATLAAAQAGTANTSYMTPLRVKEAIIKLGGDQLATHTTLVNNPHEVTKAQVGLGSVPNYAGATQAEAQAGAIDTAFMTPLRVKEAITQLVGTAFGNHASSQMNPHNVSKTQVGLNNVENYLISTQQEAIDGTATDRYMTPLRTTQLVRQYVSDAMLDHTDLVNNPHFVTKAQVGLSSVANYAVATQAEAEAGVANNAYMTPARTSQAIAAQLGITSGTHQNDTENPHATTKSQVGLGSVENYATATTAEAQAGSINTAFMTPLRTAQAITALVGTAFSNHAGSTSNPHAVTKLQVGLGNVENYLIASKLEAETATANDRYMTPLRTIDLVRVFVAEELDGHTALTNNPHGVTKAQVGLGSVENYALAMSSEAQAGLINTAFMTPLRTKEAIAFQVGAALSDHAINQLNPHGVTKQQVGLVNVENYLIASKAEAEAGLLNDRYMTPLRTSDLIRKYVLDEVSGHSTLTNNPHAVTKQQVGLGNVENYLPATKLQAEAGVVNDRYMTPLRTIEAIAALAAPKSHISDQGNPHLVTASQVGAYSKTEIDTSLGNYVLKTADWIAGQTKAAFTSDLMLGTIANSLRFEGLTKTELFAEAINVLDDDFARTTHRFSRHLSTTADPVSYPNRWILVGSVHALTVGETGSVNSIAKTYPDAFWFFSGGHKHLLDDDANAAVSSSGYLLRAHNGGNALATKLDMVRLSGTAETDVRIGYTYNAVGNSMDVWAKVFHGYNDINVVRLSPLGNNNDMTTDITDVEPSGITYVTPEGYSSTTSHNALADRVTVLEDIINSISIV
jgi:hypothetical protein